MNVEIEKLVEKLQLQPHPEGGFYAETYRSAEIIMNPAGFEGDRTCSTAIYFLLTAGNFSAFHRIKSDEVWHFYLGDAVQIHAIDNHGQYTCHVLGNRLQLDEKPQLVIPAGQWFASESVGPMGYSLVGCTVAPGFDFADFELGERAALLRAFPAHEQLVNRLTR